MRRRTFLAGAVTAPLTATGLSMAGSQREPAEDLYHGRVPGYKPFRVIDSGLTIKKIETFTKGAISVVKLTTDDGSVGWGQISTYDADISAMVLHRRVARHFLGKDPADIDSLVDRAHESGYKYPWSYGCRALGGVDTALWDLYGKIKQKPVVELLGGKAVPIPAYASSMRRDITPEKEAERLSQLKDQFGYRAFKVRVGSVNGHNQDASPGRTKRLIPMIRKSLGDDVALLVDGNSCYTPDKAIEVGRMLEDNNYYWFEEPCPYWELEWTAQVTKALNMNVAGGEQDNDLAQWRRMIRMDAVDIIQPDTLYLGGIVRTIRAAQMAAYHGKKCVPHSANVAMVTVFTLHLMGAIPNAGPFFEYSIEPGDVTKEARILYSPQLEAKDGAVQIPLGPGWGVEFNQSWLANTDYRKSEV